MLHTTQYPGSPLDSLPTSAPWKPPHVWLVAGRISWRSMVISCPIPWRHIGTVSRGTRGARGPCHVPSHKEIDTCLPSLHTRTYTEHRHTHLYTALYIYRLGPLSHTLSFPSSIPYSPLFGYSPCLTFFISSSPYTHLVVSSHNGDGCLLFAHNTGPDHQD